MQKQDRAFPVSLITGAEARRAGRFGGLLVVVLAGCLSLAVAQQSDTLPNAVSAAGAIQPANQQKPDEKENQENAKKKKKKKPSRGSIVAAPLPLSSPAIGTGVVPVVGYIFPFSEKDKVSPPSTIGVAGLWTNDGSRGCAVGGQLFFKENRYQVTAGFAKGNLNYNIYGPGDFSDSVRLPL